jgi:hypothetical protein
VTGVVWAAAAFFGGCRVIGGFGISALFGTSMVGATSAAWAIWAAGLASLATLA